MNNISDNLFWDQLIQLMAEERVIPIIGLDLLNIRYNNKSISLYSLLAEKLAEYLDIPQERVEENHDLESVVCSYLVLGRQIEDIYSAIKIIMPKEGEIELPESIKKLVSIPAFKIFITTTFDNMIEQAINEIRYSGDNKATVYSYTPNSIQDLPSSLDKLPSTAVYHLFGRVSAIPNYAVTQEDTLEYMHALQSESRQPRILFDELSRSNLLILGCCFGDWLAKFFIRTTKRQRLYGARGSTNYVADKFVNNDSKLVYFLKHFSSSTKVYDRGDAPEFIDELHKRWFEIHPESQIDDYAVVKPSTNSHGSVFLSYANEDQLRVEKIKNALEESGIEVFYDKTSLEIGDEFDMKLKRAISECSLFIPVISQNTLSEQRRFFRKEWNYAIDESLTVAANQKFILPVVIDDTSPDNQALPEKFQQLHWQRLTDGKVPMDFISTVRNIYRDYQKQI